MSPEEIEEALSELPESSRYAIRQAADAIWSVDNTRQYGDPFFLEAALEIYDAGLL